MNIDSAEVITIRMIRPSATPTILRRIDWLNSENDLTTSRMDRGAAGEAEPSCFKFAPCPTDWNGRITPQADPDQRGQCRAPSPEARSRRSIAELDQAAAPSPRRHDGAVCPATIAIAIAIAVAIVGIAVIVVVPGITQAVTEPDAEADESDAPSEAAASPAPSGPTPGAAAPADAAGA